MVLSNKVENYLAIVMSDPAIGREIFAALKAATTLVDAGAQVSAYTQTYSTANKTHADPTAAALGGSLTGTLDNILADVSGAFDATAIATINKNFKEFQDELTKMVADMADIKQLVNSVIDDLQTLELLH